MSGLCSTKSGVSFLTLPTLAFTRQAVQIGSKILESCSAYLRDVRNEVTDESAPKVSVHRSDNDIGRSSISPDPAFLYVIQGAPRRGGLLKKNVTNHTYNFTARWDEQRFGERGD